MARSKYIYVVREAGKQFFVIGAYTVKHEMITMLKRQRQFAMTDDWFEVLRFHDGYFGSPEVITSQIQKEMTR